MLNVAAELVENMVNHLICCFHESFGGVVTEVKPKGVIEERYFFVLLLELFAPVSGALVPGKEQGDRLLTVIHRISENPQLYTSNAANVGRLGRRSREFLDWLTHKFAPDLYSTNLGKTIPVTFSRGDALYLVGNRCKHSLVRSDRVIQRLVQKYREGGARLEEGEEALVLHDIDTLLLDDFGTYHFTKICELCSNLYHAIIEYVRPEYEIRVRQNDDLRWSYDIPTALRRSDYISEFYELFNRVRNPWVPFIQTDPILTLRY